MYKDINRVYGQKVSKEFVFGRDKFVFGVEDEEYLNSIVMYRVAEGDDLNPAFWYEMTNWRADMSLVDFIKKAIDYFSMNIVNKYLDNDDLDEQEAEITVYDQILEVLLTIEWDDVAQQLTIKE